MSASATIRPSSPSEGITPFQRTLQGSRPMKPARKVISAAAPRSWHKASDGPRAKPAQRIHRQEGRNQKCRDAEDLQRQIATNAPKTPIQLCAGRPASGSRCGVQRRIERRVGNQGEDKEDREDEHQEADQLIEPPVGRRSECARTDIHFGVRSFCRSSACEDSCCTPSSAGRHFLERAVNDNA